MVTILRREAGRALLDNTVWDAYLVALAMWMKLTLSTHLCGRDLLPN